MPTPEPMDITGVAVAIGRIEVSLDNVQKLVTKMDEKFDGVSLKVQEHSVHLQKSDGRLDAHDVILADIKPVKSGWPTIVSALVGLAGITAAGLAFIIK